MRRRVRERESANRERPGSALENGLQMFKLSRSNLPVGKKGAASFSSGVRCFGTSSSSSCSKKCKSEINRRTANVGVGLLMGSLVPALTGQRGVSASAAKIDVEQLLEGYQWPDEFPFRAQDFARFDEVRACVCVLLLFHRTLVTGCFGAFHEFFFILTSSSFYSFLLWLTLGNGQCFLRFASICYAY